MKKIKELFMTSPSIKHTFNYHLKKCVNIFEKERTCVFYPLPEPHRSYFLHFFESLCIFFFTKRLHIQK